MKINTSEKALVSVIITTYNNEVYLPRAIESVLRQSYSPIELIVVDDNPPESAARLATEKIMERYPQVIYLRHTENKNGAAARNTGIREARGEYIAFLDNDDFYFSNHIASCVEAIETHPECGSVLCGVAKICGGICWDVISAPEKDAEEALLFSETAIGTGSNLFAKTDIVRAIHGFDESFRRHQDVEFGLRLFAKCRAYSLNEVQIVKEMDGFSNKPNFDNFLKTKQHLWNKFQKKINVLTEDEKKRFYAGQYSALLYTACKGGDLRQVKWTVSQLKNYRSVSGKEKLLLVLNRLHLFPVYEGVKKIIKRRKSGQIYKRVVQNMTKEDLQTFQQALYGVQKG